MECAKGKQDTINNKNPYFFIFFIQFRCIFFLVSLNICNNWKDTTLEIYDKPTTTQNNHQGENERKNTKEWCFIVPMIEKSHGLEANDAYFMSFLNVMLSSSSSLDRLIASNCHIFFRCKNRFICVKRYERTWENDIKLQLFVFLGHFVFERKSNYYREFYRGEFIFLWKKFI